MNQTTREAILRRVAASPCAAELVLRGGMRTRLLCPAVPRVVADVDFLACFPFSLENTAARLRQALALPVADGVEVGDAIDATVIWGDTPFPGVRLQVPVAQAVERGQVQVDVGFGDPLVPEAEWAAYPCESGEALRLRLCRAETLLGWKVHGLFERGYGQWRPKDLFDIYLLLSCGRLEAAWLPAALDAAFRSRDTPLEVAARLLYGPFGASRGSQAKWARFRRAGSAAHIPERARDVVEIVAAGLRPAFAALGLAISST